MESNLVAEGEWLYGGVSPRKVEIRSRPATFALSRFKKICENEEDDDPRIDESAPIPQTPDGRVYYVYVTVMIGPEFSSLEDAKAWVESQPWSPIRWKRI